MSVLLSDFSSALFTGSGTTAIGLSNTIYCLLRNPKVYRRIQEEVDQFYPRGEDTLDPKHHSSMPYMQAVM